MRRLLEDIDRKVYLWSKPANGLNKLCLNLHSCTVHGPDGEGREEQWRGEVTLSGHRVPHPRHLPPGVPDHDGQRRRRQDCGAGRPSWPTLWEPI